VKLTERGGGGQIREGEGGKKRGGEGQGGCMDRGRGSGKVEGRERDGRRQCGGGSVGDRGGVREKVGK